MLASTKGLRTAPGSTRSTPRPSRVSSSDLMPKSGANLRVPRVRTPLKSRRRCVRNQSRLHARPSRKHPVGGFDIADKWPKYRRGAGQWRDAFGKFSEVLRQQVCKPLSKTCQWALPHYGAVPSRAKTPSPVAEEKPTLWAWSCAPARRCDGGNGRSGR